MYCDCASYLHETVISTLVAGISPVTGSNSHTEAISSSLSITSPSMGARDKRKLSTSHSFAVLGPAVLTRSHSSSEDRSRANQSLRWGALETADARWCAQIKTPATIQEKKTTTLRVWFAKWKTQGRVQVRDSSDSGEISVSALCGVESKRAELHPSRILSHIRSAHHHAIDPQMRLITAWAISHGG